MLALAAPASAQAECANADLEPAAGNLPEIAQATLCLLNAERAAHARGPLTQNAQLDAASLAFSRRMVTEGFFSHESPEGGTLVQRLTAAGYVGDRADWVVGENLAWGQGPLSTPRAIVSAWMNSPGHRNNVLSSEYREIGLGIEMGTPPNRSWGATYTTDFGAHASKAGDDGADTSTTPSAAVAKVEQARKLQARVKARAKARAKANARAKARARARVRAIRARQARARARARARMRARAAREREARAARAPR